MKTSQTRPSLWSELKTLFWLQGKLTLAMFRSRRAADWFWLLRVVLTIIQVAFSFPMFIVMGIGTAIGLALLSPKAAFEAVIIGNTLMTLIWLMMPSMYSSQLMERFEMSRLFPHPISFRGIVIGSTLAATLNVTGLWTLPILVGEVAGLAWHKPLALPLIACGAMPAFALFVLVGRMMDDFFDLVASDRRLRTLVLFLLSVPFMILGFGQYFVQYATKNFETLPNFIDPALVSQLEQAQGISEVLEIVRLSRFLIWLPPGWVSAGMGTVVAGHWGTGILFLALSSLAVAGLLWLHAKITRRLMEGAALTVGVQRVRSQGMGFILPGPTAFWALFAKDWRYLWRSPMPRRMVFAATVTSAMLFLSLLGIPAGELPSAWAQNLYVVIGIFLLVMLNLMFNTGITANYFGTIDREGFGTLTTSASNWGHVLLAANLAMLLFTGSLFTLIFLVVAVISGHWREAFLLLYTGIATQISTTPAYTFAAIVGPYRTELKYSRQNRGGNLWGMLAWLLATPPVALLILLPYFTYKPALIITLPLSALYAAGLYILTLRPLSKLLQRRAHVVLERVTKD